ncbi:unnamed protein product [Tenebrio molitor]|nr:unnamed protein product [Tenebrio molitor]
MYGWRRGRKRADKAVTDRKLKCFAPRFRRRNNRSKAIGHYQHVKQQRTNDGINLVMDGSTLGLFTTTFHDSVT